MAPSHLLLFDIDGTLLTTNGEAVRAMMAAYREVYGVEPPSDGLLMDGKTELRIAHELLGMCGLTREQVDAGLPRFWDCYDAELVRQLSPAGTTVYPGVRELLAALRPRADTLLGLLTGNTARSAWRKLAMAGLDGFPVGAYGEHHEEREALPALAIEAAEAHCGRRFTGKAVVILGDTPSDVRCGQHLGVKTIAVATGLYSREALAAEHPDHLFDDFTDVPAVLRALYGDNTA
jgi:phosphoglycolate phosphatase-like HAD superfamily hydrolase